MMTKIFAINVIKIESITLILGVVLQRPIPSTISLAVPVDNSLAWGLVLLGFYLLVCL